jgi:hypothetical protein
LAAAIAGSVVAGAAKAKVPARTNEPSRVAAARTRAADWVNIVYTPKLVAIAGTSLSDITNL